MPIKESIVSLRSKAGFRSLNKKIYLLLYMEKKEESYNEAVEKLHTIVDEIEKGDLDIDLLSEKVREATRLIKLCKEKLYKVDEEVKKALEELEA